MYNFQLLALVKHGVLILPLICIHLKVIAQNSNPALTSEEGVLHY